MTIPTPRIKSSYKLQTFGENPATYELLKMRKVNLFGPVNETLAADVITQLEYLDRQSGKDIYLYINSGGGEIAAGLSIMDAMNRCRSKVTTVCTGMAASMGAFLLACGTGKRFITRNAEVMIHQPLGGIQGQATDMEIATKRILKTKKKLDLILAEKTGQNIKTIEKDTDRDYWLNAEEAKAYGLVDKILDTPLF